MRSLHELCRELLGRHRVPAEPAVDVEALAGRLGVRVMERRITDGALGRVEVRGEVVEIQLRPGLLRGRRRFVLGHELGHVIGADPGLHVLALRRQLGWDEERFCDRFAEALLLPEHWLRARYASRAASLAALFECARVAQVSPAAAAVALHRTAGWRRTLLRFQRRADAWRLLSVTGHLPVPPERLRTPDALGSMLDQEACDGGRLRKAVVPLTVGGHCVHVPADGLVDGRRAYLLVDLRSLQRD